MRHGIRRAIRGKVEAYDKVALRVRFSVYTNALVQVMYTYTWEQWIERVDILSVVKSGLQGFARYLHSVNVQREVVDVEMLKVEGIEFSRTIESSVINEAYQNSSR